MDIKDEDDPTSKAQKAVGAESGEGKPAMKCFDYFMEWKKCMCKSASLVNINETSIPMLRSLIIDKRKK